MRSQGISTLFATILFAPAFLPSQTASSIQFPSEQPAQSLDKVSPSAPGSNRQINAALDVLEMLLEQHRKSGNRAGQADTLVAMANSYNAAGQQQRAIEHFQLALALYREINDKKNEAGTLSHLGHTYRGWGFPEQSIPFYRQAIAIDSQNGDEPDKAVVLNNLGVAYLELRNRKKCFDYLNQALALYRAMKDCHGEALTLSNIGMAYNFLTNDSQKSMESLQEAMTKLQLTDDRNSEATVLDNIGSLCLKTGQKQMAALSFDHALTLFRREGNAQGEARVLKHLKLLDAESVTIASAESALEAH